MARQRALIIGGSVGGLFAVAPDGSSGADAGDELVELIPMLRRVVGSRIKDPHTVEDLVQEIFDVQVLPGLRFPEFAEHGSDAVNLSYVVPDDALAVAAATSSTA